MHDIVAAFCPGHISGYFRPVITGDPETSGSLGGGIVISEGVTVEVRMASDPVVDALITDPTPGMPSRLDDSPPIRSLMGLMGVTAHVKTRCRLPVRAGFGLSAAALLATAHALNRLFGLGLSGTACASLAHITEVRCRTGLGDIAACQGGGRECRRSPGIRGEIRRWNDLPEPLAAVIFGSMESPSILGDERRLVQITEAFPGDCAESAADFFTHSRAFAERSGLSTPQVRKALKFCDRHEIPASMTMLGNGIFAYGARAPDILRPLGKVYQFGMAQSGVTVYTPGDSL